MASVISTDDVRAMSAGVSRMPVRPPRVRHEPLPKDPWSEHGFALSAGATFALAGAVLTACWLSAIF